MKRTSPKGKQSAPNTKMKLPRVKATRPKVMAVLLAAVMLLSFLTANGADLLEDGADSLPGYEQTDETGNGMYADAEEEPAETPAEEPAEPSEEASDENQDDEMPGESAEEEPTEDEEALPAEDTLNLNALNAGNPGYGYEVTEQGPDKALIFNTAAHGNEYTITQDNDAHGFQQIVVKEGVTATITIDGISLTSGIKGVPLFSLQGTANVTLILNGNNTLVQTATESGNNAALNVPENAAIIIKGDGNLTAQGGFHSAGIGGGNGGVAGNITINGTADVTATGGAGSAGIGAGNAATGASGTITISGNAQVNATGGNHGAGIGGGYNSTGYTGDAGIINITGNASVTATGGTGGSDGNDYGGAGIGAGSGYNNDGKGAILTIDSSARVRAYSSNISDGTSTNPIKAARPAIHASSYEGTAYLVNAKPDAVSVSASERTLKVSGNSGAPQELTLPANYANFAYTTGGSQHIARIVAFTGSKPTGLVVLADGSDSAQIVSTNTAAEVIKGKAVKIDQVIDLSDGTTWGGPGFVVNTNAPRILTFKENREYYVYQSGESLIRNIVVNDNVTATITIDGINMTCSERGVPTFALTGSANVTLILENSNTLTQTATIDGNNAALNVPSGTSITVQGNGSLNVNGGYYSAGIGGGSAGAGGNPIQGTAGKITINGGIVTATGGAFGAGIGSGYSGNGGTTIISSGTVTATGGIRGAGIGGGSPGTNNKDAGAGGNITISGGTVTATGGRALTGDNFAGAGIGSSGAQANGGTIAITGNADVTATGGMNASKNASGAGIGSGYVTGSNGTCDLKIDASAKVKAYAYGSQSGAIQSVNNGTGNFVNAYFSDMTGFPDPATATRLDVYAKGSAVKTNELVLPAGYYAFAYTTGNTQTQNDHILAYDKSNGNILGSVLRNDNNSQKIGSGKSNTKLAVKLGSSPGIPSLSVVTVEAVTQTSATFVSRGHYLRDPAIFQSGKFQYSTSSNMSNPTPENVAWGMSKFDPDPVSVPVAELEPNTRYYLRTQLTTSLDTYSSEVVSFATLPLITSASAKPSADGKKTLIGAEFYESKLNNANITDVTIYWSTGAIDASDLGNVTASAALNSQKLDSATFSNTGFSNYAIPTGARNNILIVVTNDDGRTASYSPATTLTVSGEVTGDYADPTKKFAFTVKFMDGNGNALAANTAFSYTGSAISGVTAPAGGILKTNANGEVSFELGHGQSVTIAGVASDDTVQITQKEAPVYEVSFTDSEKGTSETGYDTGVRDMKPRPRSFSFTNERDNNVAVSGIDAGNIGAVLLLPILASLALCGFWIVRRAYCGRSGGDRR